jgi:hypothetical protein
MYILIGICIIVLIIWSIVYKPFNKSQKYYEIMKYSPKQNPTVRKQYKVSPISKFDKAFLRSHALNLQGKKGQLGGVHTSSLFDVPAEFDIGTTLSLMPVEMPPPEETMPRDLEAELEAVSDNFPRIVRTQVQVPSVLEIEQKYRDSVASGDTLKGCLTVSRAGLFPEMCMELCAETYGQLSKFCSSTCNKMMMSQRNSCAGGTC